MTPTGNFERIVQDAEDGYPSTILRNGEPVAVVVGAVDLDDLRWKLDRLSEEGP